jgi:predicted nucleotidyltransferase
MVNIYKLELTSLQRKILRYLFINAGKKLNQRRLSIGVGATPPAIMKALPKLRDAGIINMYQDKESKRWIIELNRDNLDVIRLKRVDNLLQVYECGLVDFLDREFAGATIILFGSYSKGEDSFNSDVDIAVIGRKPKSVELSKFEKQLGREININFYDSFNKINKHLRNNILNGIVLSGRVEL